MQPLISLIIPIYNTAKYLQSCLDSILQQNLQDIEIILVDDGSSDESPKICDDYASKNTKIKVIHKINEGLSCARNCGLKVSTGKYIWFIDSDDFVLKHSLYKVKNSIKENESIEVFSSGLLRFYEDSETFIPENIPYGTLFERKGDYLWQACPAGASVRFICKRKFLLDNELFFQRDLLHEDGEWGYRMLYLTSRVKVIEEPIYVYRIRSSGSIMSGIKIKSAYDLIKGHKSLLTFMEKHVLIEDRQKYRLCIWNMVLAIYNFCHPLFHTKDFEIFLDTQYSYIRHQAFALLLSNPFRLKNYFYVLHPYSQDKILKLMTKFGIKKK